MSDKTIELKALEECLVKSLDQYSHTLETAQRRQKDQSTWRREMLAQILDEWDRHDEEELRETLPSVEHAKRSLHIVQHMLKRARPSDSLDDCKWERTKVFQASRDLIFSKMAHLLVEEIVDKCGAMQF